MGIHGFATSGDSTVSVKGLRFAFVSRKVNSEIEKLKICTLPYAFQTVGAKGKRRFFRSKISLKTRPFT